MFTGLVIVSAAGISRVSTGTGFSGEMLIKVPGTG
jgi:hypothetical protein